MALASAVDALALAAFSTPFFPLPTNTPKQNCEQSSHLIIFQHFVFSYGSDEELIDEDAGVDGRELQENFPCAKRDVFETGSGPFPFYYVDVDVPAILFTQSQSFSNPFTSVSRLPLAP